MHPRPDVQTTLWSLVSLTCTDVRFVEVDFPRTLRPRLVIEFSEGLSFLLANRSAILLAADFIATVHQHLAAKTRRTKADCFSKNLKFLVHGVTDTIAYQSSIHTDGYGVYDAVAPKFGLRHGGCLAHVRRKFTDLGPAAPEVTLTHLPPHPAHLLD